MLITKAKHGRTMGLHMKGQGTVILNSVATKKMTTESKRGGNEQHG